MVDMKVSSSKSLWIGEEIGGVQLSQMYVETLLRREEQVEG